MVVYTARSEVLNLKKSSEIWPKELQLITRTTDTEARKLAGLFKKQVSLRHEPFQEVEQANALHSTSKVTLIVDLSKQKSSAFSL